MHNIIANDTLYANIFNSDVTPEVMKAVSVEAGSLNLEYTRQTLFNITSQFGSIFDKYSLVCESC